MQGKTCQTWVKKEFQNIKQTIDKCIKGGNSKLKIDNEIKILPPVLSEMNKQSEEETDSQTIPKVVNDSFECIDQEPQHSEDKQDTTEQNKITQVVMSEKNPIVVIYLKLWVLSTSLR